MLFIRVILLLLISVSAWAADEAESTRESTAVDPEQAASTGAPKNTGDNAELPMKSAENDTPPPITYITPDKAKQRLDDVLRYLKAFQRENEIIEISGNDSNLAGLYLPENTGSPQGGVLILHDISQHAHWPNTVTPIREYLPDYGWNTLSIFYDQYIEKPLPKVEPFSFKNAVTVNDIGQPIAQETTTLAETDSATPQNSETTESSPEESSTEPPIDLNLAEETTNSGEGGTDALDDIANNLESVPEFTPEISQEVLEQPAIPIEETFIENMIARTEQGLTKLNEMGQFNIVIIANGYSANWAVKTLEKRIKGNSKGFALILIDAKASEYPPINLNESLSELDIPILDIITQYQPEQLRQSKTRKGAMLRNQKKQYSQLFMPAVKPSLPNNNNMIARRIRGWLLTHAAGEEVAVKTKTY